MICRLRARLAAGAALLLCCLLVLAPGAAAAPAAKAANAEDKPAVALSLQEAAKGSEITVTGTGWRAKTLVMLLLCGQNMIGGTNSCANADGAAVSTGDDGRFTARLAVVAPPKPCPCVVNVTSVGGDQATVAAPVKITDHPVAELPAEAGSPRLAMLSGVRLVGEDGILTWFGAPPGRTFTVTVGNLGPAPVTNPVFQLGTAHGVFAPLWEEVRWKGTIPPGGKAEVRLAVALSAGAHGDYTVSLKYGDTVVATQPWRVSRPYGVLLFWGLLLLVVPAGLFRAGMAVVERARPRATPAVTAPAAPAAPTAPATAPAPTTTTATTAVLPWFTAPQASAPSGNSPTTKGQA
ncbi:neocarzinostatin apoprotein domain-containing protein [Streptomyces sp. NPDC007369]|uniref:neocarzinostatin apoprotein domain-containing protein n=1 Tax=Streptomyces sp. NPDC007369 TaxID=3154589 RepID=UPI0033F9D21D